MRRYRTKDAQCLSEIMSWFAMCPAISGFRTQGLRPCPAMTMKSDCSVRSDAAGISNARCANRLARTDGQRHHTFSVLIGFTDHAKILFETTIDAPQ
jgi:hypothetical protein